MVAERQRIDKWLWHARVVKTRTAAAALVTSGCVRLNGERNNAASQPVKAGDVVTIALDRRVRVLKVAGFAERRGASAQALALFVDLSEPPGPRPGDPPAVAVREAGQGRPTKRERRAWSRLTGEDAG